jgi:hypothetical protein
VGKLEERDPCGGKRKVVRRVGEHRAFKSAQGLISAHIAHEPYDSEARDCP